MHEGIAPVAGDCACSAQTADECIRRYNRWSTTRRRCGLLPNYFGHLLMLCVSAGMLGLYLKWLRPITAKVNKYRYRQWRRLTVIHTRGSYFHSPRVGSSDFGLLGEQSSPKWEIPCPGCPWTTVQNLTPLARTASLSPCFVRLSSFYDRLSPSFVRLSPFYG